MITFLLALIAVLLVVIVWKLHQLVSAQIWLRESLRVMIGGPYYRWPEDLRFSDNAIRELSNPAQDGVIGLLVGLKRQIWEIQKNTDPIPDYLLADNPAGVGTNKYKRMNNLIPLYAQHLIVNEKLSREQALARARFEYHRFGQDRLVNEIESEYGAGLYAKEQAMAEENYFNTGLLEKDLAKIDKKKIEPMKLAFPLYMLKDIHHTLEGLDFGIKIDAEQKEYSYSVFLENRAIPARLEELGIIRRSDNYTEARPRWTMLGNDWQGIKDKIYHGKDSPSDGEFKEAKDLSTPDAWLFGVF